jgi:hypothetical protein
LNRYSYVMGNPVNGTDPSGNRPCENDDCDVKTNIMINDFGWKLNGDDFTAQDIARIFDASMDISRKAGGKGNVSKLFGDIEFAKKKMDAGGITGNAHHIWFNVNSAAWTKWSVVHELGHALDISTGGRASETLVERTHGYTASFMATTEDGCDNAQRMPGCNFYGYFYGGIPPAGSDVNFNRFEDFAETFAAYVYPEKANGLVSRYQAPSNPYHDYLYYSDYRKTPRWSFINGFVFGIIQQ